MGDAPPRPAPRVPWTALGTGFAVLFVCSGVNFSFGILFKPILMELGSDRSTLALAATASLCLNAVGQPLLGALIDRIGPRRVILPSMALMALGTGLAGLAQSPWHFVLLYGVVVAVGSTGTGILPISVHITRWFPGERGFVMAVAASGFSLGHLVFTQLAARATVAAGWRRAYRLMAAILLAALPVIAVWLRDAPRVGPRGAAGNPTRDALGSVSRRAALGTPAFWWLTIGLMGCGFTDFLLTTHLPAFAADLGLAPTVAANAVSLWAAANIAGILVAGSFAARVGSRQALVATYALRAVSLFYLSSVRDAWQLYLFAILFGATFFTTAPLSSTLVGSLFGPAHHGLIFGTANLFHHIAGAIGAYAGGVVFDLTGSYLTIFLASGIMVTVSAAVTWLARSAGRPPGGTDFWRPETGR